MIEETRTRILGDIMQREQASVGARSITLTDSAFLDDDALVIVTYFYEDGMGDIIYTTRRMASYEYEDGTLTPRAGIIYGQERREVLT